MDDPANSKSSLELLDGAFHLLRHAPARLWLIYVLGAAPFVLFACYEWQWLHMPASGARVPLHAAGFALLFLWFAMCRGLFARALKALIWQTQDALTVRQAANQLLLQVGELAVTPFALLSIGGVPWMIAFFHFPICAPDSSLKLAIANSARRASRIQRQSWALTATAGAIFLATVVNLFGALLIVPALFKAFSGYETPFTGNPMFTLNGATALAVVAAALMLTEALLLAAFVLVLFYEDSEESGRDLLLQLKDTPEARDLAAESQRLRSIATTAIHFVVAIAAFGAIPAVTHAAETSRAVTPYDFNRQITHVLHDGKYYWVNPSAGQAAAEPDFGPVRLFVNLAGEGWAGVVKGINAVMHWIRQLFQKSPASHPPPASGRAHVSIWLLACLALMALGAAGALVLRGRGRLVAKMLPPSAVPATPDLYNEQVLATELPEQEWIELASNYLQRQELRLAVRALYLAALATLARQELLAITPYKTNADYTQELRRRARAMPAVDIFARNGRQYESAWYGRHEPPPEVIQAFEQDVQQLRNLSHA